MDWTRLVRERLRDDAGAVPPDAIVEELAEHLEERYDDAVAAGADPAAARRDALTELADMDTLALALRSRAAHGAPGAPPPPSMEDPHMWSDLSADVRYAARLLLRNRGFTTA